MGNPSRHFKKWKEENTPSKKSNFRFVKTPGGESTEDVRVRMDKFLKKLYKKRKGEDYIAGNSRLG